MKKYLVLYLSDMSAVEAMEMSEEDRKAELGKWMTWSQKVGDKLVDFGMPLGATSKVTEKGTHKGNNSITGYSFINADSVDEALKMMEGHPHLAGKANEIEVHETMPVPGM